MTDIVKSCTRLHEWFVSHALPLWSERGYDHVRGGFYEALDFSGAPLTGRPRRVRVQARQIYTFTQSALQGWCSDGEPLAAKAFDFYIDKACPDNGARGCVHQLADNGDIIDDRRDLYDQAFLLLACAARLQTGDDRARTLADRTIDFLNAELSSPNGGWLESDAGELPRRQNPHMHLFEAFIALFETTGDKTYLSYADGIHTLFRTRFYDATRSVLIEYFNADLTQTTQPKGKLIEPGHMMEWVWLLDRYEDCGGKIDHHQVDELFHRAILLGANDKGFLLDQMSLDRHAPSAAMRRLWPQTEYVKAALVMTQRSAKTAETKGAQMIDRLFETYLNQPVAGLWCDRYCKTGDAAAQDVPASILYHLYEAAAQASTHVKTIEAS
ncbi:MAG: AGE family epimerase/isomerase [Pseudomonadota bacterium]